MLEKIYANMAACHIKNSNWKRVLECVDKVCSLTSAIFQWTTHESFSKTLAKNPNNYKALFRRAKALGETGYFERAEKILEDIMKKSPAGASSCAPILRCTPAKSFADEPAAKAELARLRAMDKERERKHNQKLKGSFSSLFIMAITSNFRLSIFSGWLSRDKSALKDDTPESLVEQVKSAKIEELNDDA